MKNKGSLYLLCTAMIWGCAFSAQSAGAEYIGPWTFNCIRGFIGALTLYLFLPLLDRIRNVSKPADEKKGDLLKAGISCGVILCAASMTQQAGIAGSTAGKAGFLTSLYIIFVPFLSVFLGKKTGARIWLAAVIAAAGLYFLSVTGSSSFSAADILLILCAVLFAVHILVIDAFSHTDSIRMSCMQFAVMGIVCLVPMVMIERPVLSNVLGAMPSLLYTGIFSCGIAYTLQIIGQKDTDPSAAGILLSLESVFAALSGFLILHQSMTGRELIGCVLMFTAVMIAVTSGPQED